MFTAWTDQLVRDALGAGVTYLLRDLPPLPKKDRKKQKPKPRLGFATPDEARPTKKGKR